MPSVHERLDRIIAAYIPKEVVYRVDCLSMIELIILKPVVVKNSEVRELLDDKELQDAFKFHIAEVYNEKAEKFCIAVDANTLWYRIQDTIIKEYEEYSLRCAATNRKTIEFIRLIHIDDKHLSNFLVQMFLKIKSPAYQKYTLAERGTLFDQLEALRRSYGKRR